MPSFAGLASSGACVLGLCGSPDPAIVVYRHPWADRGCYPGRAGGPWLCRTFVLSLFQAVVVPSGLRIRVQPHWWMTIWVGWDRGALPGLLLVGFPGLIDGSGGAEADAGMKRTWTRTASAAATRRM